MTIDNSSDTLKEPTVKPTGTISVIWILPLLALAICGWLLYESYTKAGIDISIVFDNANGVTAGKTEVIAKGIPIGVVKELIPDLEKNQVIAKVKMNKEVERFLVEDTLFWVVRPELSAARIQGLETIFTGSYIGIQAGSATKARRVFTGLQEAPPLPHSAPGLHLTLRAETLGSIQVGTGIYYKNIEIGSVQSYTLKDGSGILVDLHIKPEYTHLVREKSRFCNASGIHISGQLTNIKIQVESLASLLRGGILLFTPKELQHSDPAQNGQLFTLYKDYEAAEYGIPMTLQLASGKDIMEGGTKVMYRGLEAGIVKEILINDDTEKSVTANILLDPRAELILRKNTLFWMVKPSLTPSGIDNLQTLIGGPHITFRPGDGPFQDHFVILPEPPPENPLRAGKSFLLTSSNEVQVSQGGPVYFKEIKVGEVVALDLAADGSGVETQIFIYEPYTRHVSTNSVFWQNSGVDISIDSGGLQLETGPLARLLVGGISFVTPPAKGEQLPAEKDRVFTLFENKESAIDVTPSLRENRLFFQLRTEKPGSLDVGSPIMHRTITIGKVQGVKLSSDLKTVLIDCYIYQKYGRLLNDTTRFYSAGGIELSGDLSGVSIKTESLQAILKGGISCITSDNGKRLKGRAVLPLYPSLEAALDADHLEVTIRIGQPGNLKVGSNIQYKGISIGKIDQLRFAENLQEILLLARIDPQMADLFRTGTRVWRVKPEVSLHGVKNLGTVLGSEYLQIVPGAGKPRRTFTALEAPPQNPNPKTGGLFLILESPTLGSLTVGSPIYYRQLQVGEVTGYELSSSFRKVYIFVNIEKQYKPIVRTNSKFWNISGTHIEGGLFSGLTFSTSSLEAIVRGGIAMASPNNEEIGEEAQHGDHFSLYPKVEKEWLDWNPDIVLLEREQNTKPINSEQ